MSIEAMKQAIEALEEIALAGMSGTGQESEEGMRDWHARQAWKFIGITARALDPLRAAIQQAEAQQPATGDPVGQVSDLFPSVRNKLHAKGFGSDAPLYTHPAPGVPEFYRIAKRKLDELQEQGFAITGYAIQRGPVRGFIDGSGFVGWWQCEPDPGVPDDVVRDAERYRWLRSLEHCNEAWCLIGSGNANSNLDAAIDAAMLAASPAQKGGE